MEQNNQLFRQKSLDRISSPEDLNKYLKVANVSAWMVLVSVIVLIVGLLVWSATGEIVTKTSVVARVKDNVANIVHTGEIGNKPLAEGMEIEIGSQKSTLDSVVKDVYDRYNATAYIDVPDGQYEALITVERDSPLSYLF